MKAVMSKRVKEWLSSKRTAKELMAAIDKLRNSEDDFVIAVIDGKKYRVHNVK